MSKKIIVIIITVVLVLAAVGAGVWWFFFRDKEPEVNGYYEVVGVMDDGSYRTISEPTQYIKIEDNKITVWTQGIGSVVYEYVGENKIPDIFKSGMDNYYRLYVDSTFTNSADRLSYLNLKTINKSTYNTKTA